MSIYAEKRKGRSTGVFIVEVVDQGQTLKARAKTMEDAKDIERDMKRGRWQTPKVPIFEDRLSIGKLYLIAKIEGWKSDKKEKNQLKAFREVEWCLDVIGRDVPVDDLNLNHFKAITKAKQAEGNTPQTGDRMMAALSALITWGRENVDDNGKPYTTNRPAVPYSGIVRERTEWFTAQDQERLIQRMVLNGHTPEAVCCLAYGQTGMRAQELLTLKADQIGEDTITLFDQKNGTWGEGIPIQPEVARALRQIIERGAMPSYAMMLERFKKAAKAEGFKVNEKIRRKLKQGEKKARRRSTLDTVGLHTLRHSTATRLILDGENPAIVQEFMRHSSWATTRKYLKLTGAPKRNALQRLVLAEDFQASVLAKPVENAEEMRGDLRGNLRGDSGQNLAKVHNVWNIASEIVEKDQVVGSLSRTRTCDHSINRRGQSASTEANPPIKTNT